MAGFLSRNTIMCAGTVFAAAVILCLQLWSVSSSYNFRQLSLETEIDAPPNLDDNAAQSANWLHSKAMYILQLLRHDGMPSESKTELEMYKRDIAGVFAPRNKNWRHLTDADLLMKAHAAAAISHQPGAHLRVAFLFLVRGDIPHEALWRRFFQGHEKEYSIYVHATPGFRYPESSIFRGKEIVSKPVERLSGSLVDAMRRLIAHAILDVEKSNQWFAFVCESTIPIRPLPFVYKYLMTSKVSFVESFRPVQRYESWNTLPDFSMDRLRKGELWMAVHRRHAQLIIGEWHLYFKFAGDCRWMCAPDEQYIQTMLHIKDPGGIANRTIMYVDWTHPHTSSPFTFDVDAISPEFLRKIQGLEIDSMGARHDTAYDNTSLLCVHEAGKNTPCFLFARKFAAGAANVLQNISPQMLGY